MKSIQILCLEGVFDSAAHILRDVFRAASQIASSLPGHHLVQAQTCTLDGKPVKTGSGQTLRPDTAATVATPDVLVVPGVHCESADDMAAYVEQKLSSAVSRLLTQRYKSGTELATACTGAWILAETGLLDGKQATTTWHLGGEFQQRYPKVKLKLGRMVTRDRGVWCAGAVMAHMDLALAIVTAMYGAKVSDRAAALLLLDNRPSQSHYMVADFLGETSSDFREIDQWIQANLETPFSVSEWATGVGMSERSLYRRVKQATGETPAQYAQRLRVNQAIFLLETSAMSFTQITHRLGYREPASLRRLIRKQTGRSPSNFRP